ncbi:hypothetical protein M3672_09145 [Microbacterium enclense]|uniref:hypothetical protein n=1 Tax=Microbacterium enclense TaxID=993073 RepID=UPI00203E3C98|nr:hypothetical protein [Microbacterium enclense]MCM3614601.1 hypothetical protein [Microbacterium enclense]
MWLYVKDQPDPPNMVEAVGEHRGFGEYWYNFETGAVVFCTRDVAYFAVHETDHIHVWTLATPSTSHPVEVTEHLTKRQWRYTSKELGDSSLTATRQALAAKLNEVLRVE